MGGNDGKNDVKEKENCNELNKMKYEILFLQKNKRQKRVLENVSLSKLQ